METDNMDTQNIITTTTNTTESTSSMFSSELMEEQKKIHFEKEIENFRKDDGIKLFDKNDPSLYIDNDKNNNTKNDNIMKPGVKDITIRPQIEIKDNILQDWMYNGDNTKVQENQPYFIACVSNPTYEENKNKIGSRLTANPYITTINTALLGFCSKEEITPGMKWLREKEYPYLKKGLCYEKVGHWVIWPPSAASTKIKKNKAFIKLLLYYYIEHLNETSHQFEKRVNNAKITNKADEDLQKKGRSETEIEIRKMNKRALKNLHNPIFYGNDYKTFNIDELHKKHQEKLQKQMDIEDLKNNNEKDLELESELECESENESENEKEKELDRKMNHGIKNPAIEQAEYQKILKNVDILEKEKIIHLLPDFKFKPLADYMNHYKCAIISFIDLLDYIRQKHPIFNDFPKAKGLFKVSGFFENETEAKDFGLNKTNGLLIRYNKTFSHQIVKINENFSLPFNKRYTSNIYTSDNKAGDEFSKEYYSKLQQNKEMIDTMDISQEEELKKTINENEKKLFDSLSQEEKNIYLEKMKIKKINENNSSSMDLDNLHTGKAGIIKCEKKHMEKFE